MTVNKIERALAAKAVDGALCCSTHTHSHTRAITGERKGHHFSNFSNKNCFFFFLNYSNRKHRKGLVVGTTAESMNHRLTYERTPRGRHRCRSHECGLYVDCSGGESAIGGTGGGIKPVNQLASNPNGNTLAHDRPELAGQ